MPVGGRGALHVPPFRTNIEEFAEVLCQDPRRCFMPTAGHSRGLVSTLWIDDEKRRNEHG